MWFINLILCLIFVIAPIGTFFHEFGHSFAAQTLKASDIHLKIGKGKKIVSFKILKIQIDLHVFFFIGGQTESSRSPFYKKGEQIYITLLGPIMNGLVAFILMLYSKLNANIYIELAIWYNLWLFSINILPLRIKERLTDGYIVYKLLSSRKE